MPTATQPLQRILVIKLSALGDFIQALGPMAAIRRHHPKAHITLLTTKSFAGFGRKCGYFDDVIIDTRPKILDIKGWLTLRKTLLNRNFDRVYDLQNNDRSCFYYKLWPRKTKPEWVGVAKGASHRNTSPERTAGHAFDGHKQTLALAGIKDVQIDDLSWAKEDLSAFDLKTPYILFVPGCAPQHPYKRWPAEHYAALADKLHAQGYHIVLLGTDAEKDVTHAIKTRASHAFDLTGKTSLFQIAALAHQADGAVGNDTGPMHMIGPTGCPTLALFSGHSTPERHAPLGAHVKTLQKQEIKDITVDQAYTEIISQLEPSAP